MIRNGSATLEIKAENRMQPDSSTIWTTIENAARGDVDARNEFARKYLPAVAAYLGARWSGNQLAERVDDASQDVFVECFKTNGPLGRVSRETTRCFRGYLYGIARNVARRYEQGSQLPSGQPAVRLSRIDPTADETTLSQVFDRAWARSMMKQAGQRHRELAGGWGCPCSAATRTAGAAVQGRTSDPPHRRSVERRGSYVAPRVRKSARRISPSVGRRHPPAPRRLGHRNPGGSQANPKIAILAILVGDR